MPPARHLVYLAAACNESYAMPLAVMLSSVGATLAPGRRVVAFVLESDLSPATKAKVARSIDGWPIELVWLAVDPAPFAALRAGLRAFDWFTVEIYYRLLLSDLLPTDDRVIYLDCDVVVNHDLGELWDTEVGDAYVLAVPEADPDARFVSSPKGIAFYRELGLPPDLKFFNSGVLVINLRKWRQESLPLRVVTYLREAGDDVLWYDQEALNAAMAGEWAELDPRWNLMVHFEGRQSSITRAPSPFIIHFNGSSKPWHADFPHRFGELFFEHLDRTAWAGWRPHPQATASARRFARLAIKAARKRRHLLDRHLRRVRRRWHAWQVLRRPLRRLDRNPISAAGEAELRLFAVGLPSPCLPRLLNLHFRNGCDRAFLALQLSNGEAASLIERHPRAHVFARGDDPRADHEVLRHLLHAHGRGHWCLIVGANELLVVPDAATGPLKNLKDLCARLEAGGFGALRCHFIDPEGNALSVDGGGPAMRMLAPHAETELRRIATIARDPLTGRVFSAAVEVASDARWLAGTAQPRTRIVLLKFRADMAMASDLSAVDEVRDADTRGVVVRFPAPAEAAP